jgi:PIN domain nuclease of toxin-antitoxin system
MTLLLDTQMVLALVNESPPPKRRQLLERAGEQGEPLYASVVSLWEVAIKTRLRKLALTTPIAQLPATVEGYAISFLDIDRHHVLAEVDPWPPTNDPFDRLLLAQCQVEGMKLVTTDDKLIDHPLAWKPA